MTLAGQKYSVAGVLDISSGDAEGHLIIKRTPAPLGNLIFDFVIEKNHNLLRGTISDPQFNTYQSELFLGSGSPGSAEGQGETATFNQPRGIVLLDEGSIVADTGNHTLHLIEEGGQTSLLAGAIDDPNLVNGTAANARFNAPEGLALDAAGNLYIADTGNHCIRKVTHGSPRQVTTFAGTGATGAADGAAGAATFAEPCALTFDPAGNLWVVDRGNHNIRKITPAGVVTTVAGRAGPAGFKDAAAGSAARLSHPNGITYDSTLRAFFVTDTGNRVIRKVMANGAVSTYAGAAGVPGSNDGLAPNARFSSPLGITSDGQGNLYITDDLVVQITASGIVTTLTTAVDTTPDAPPADLPTAIAFAPESSTLVVADAGLHGVVTSEPAGEASTPTFTVRRTIWTASNPVPTAYVAKYTAGLTTSSTDSAAAPTGSGYATLAVAKTTGVATWAGTAADGAAWTFGTVVGPEGEVPLHAMMYKSTGSLQGLITIDSGTGDLHEKADIAFDWHKIPQGAAVVDRVNKKGFYQSGLGILGGKYIPAGHLFNFLGLAVGSTTANARADFSGGGLTAPFSQLFNLKTPSSVTLPPSVINAVTITFKPSTGLFTGSFKQGTPLRKASIAGVLARTADGSTAQGFGYFLLPQEPLAPETTANSTILSGKVTIQKAP
jgi:sugar lactone lactonase YvrE